MKDDSIFVVLCIYERLSELCFYYGMLTHTERFCNKTLENKSYNSVRKWGSWLRALTWRMATQDKSKWLREEDDQKRIDLSNSLLWAIVKRFHYGTWTFGSRFLIFLLTLYLIKWVSIGTLKGVALRRSNSLGRCMIYFCWEIKKPAADLVIVSPSK